MIVRNAMTEIPSGSFDDFFPITGHAATGTSYYLDLGTFLADKFRRTLQWRQMSFCSGMMAPPFY